MKPILFSLFLIVSLGASNVMAGDIPVMSFNIRFGTAKDGDNAWPLRKDLVVETITRF